MRENRLAKLAEMRKVAAVERSDRVSTGAAFIANKGFYETEGGKILYFDDENNEWFIAADSDGKIRGATVKSFTPVLESETYKVISSKSTVEAADKFKSFRDKAQAESAAYYEAEADKAQAKKVQSPSGAQATTAPIKPTSIRYDVGTKLRDASYEYEVMDKDGSFEWINLTDRSKRGTFSLSQSGTAKWNKAVAALNELPPQTLPVAATPATPAATTATPAAATPAAATPAAAPAATTQANPEIVSKIKEVLLRASNEPLDMKSLGNEMSQIKELNKSISSRGIDGLGSLAALVASRVGNLLPSLERATIGQIKGAKRRELAANRREFLSMDVNTILNSINDIYGEYNRAPAAFLNRYFTKPAAPATATPPAATTPATPAPAAADDGHSKDASLNKKFIKAATLRRLKIRSQMEAAIDSSAQMGRARVS